jgi:hypothetical protein
MTYDGLPWERLFKKVIPEGKKREKTVRDMPSELERIKVQTGPAQYARAFNQTEEEWQAQMKVRRRNALTLRGCMPEVGSLDHSTQRIMESDPIFDWDMTIAYDLGYLTWPCNYLPMFVELETWSENTPFKHTEKKTRAFYLSGEHRTGKSLYCKLFALRLWDRETAQNKGRTSLVRFVTVQNLVNSYLRANLEQKSLIELDFLSAKYLFLDDIGNHYGSEFNEKNILDWVGRRLNSQYTDGKKCWTFFTSNYSIDNLGFDTAVAARLKESAREFNIGPLLTRKWATKNPTETYALAGNPSYS